MSLVVDVCGRKRKASMNGVTCRGRLQPEAEGVDGRRHLSLASLTENGGVDGRCYLTTTVEGRRCRRMMLLVTDDYRREQKVSTDGATGR